eukprot:1403610-Pleurochrysis_carterae.AAC.1
MVAPILVARTAARLPRLVLLLDKLPGVLRVVHVGLLVRLRIGKGAHSWLQISRAARPMCVSR